MRFSIRDIVFLVLVITGISFPISRFSFPLLSTIVRLGLGLGLCKSLAKKSYIYWDTSVAIKRSKRLMHRPSVSLLDHFIIISPQLFHHKRKLCAEIPKLSKF